MTPETSDLNEPNDPEWEAEQREMATCLSAADLWSDYCIRKLDPCDPAFWDDALEDTAN